MESKSNMQTVVFWSQCVLNVLEMLFLSTTHPGTGERETLNINVVGTLKYSFHCYVVFYYLL